MVHASGRLGLLFVCASLWACEPGDPALPPRGQLVGPPHQVVLLTVDTLRASHLGCYGYDRDTSPFVDSLAGEGVQLMNVYAPVPRTVPSHLSMLTGLRPHVHGAIRNLHDITRAEVPSLPAFFRSRGYGTAAFVSIPFLSPKRKKLPGFEHEEAPPLGEEWRAQETLERAGSWVRAHDGEPFFLWVHIFDLHKPYDPPEPYDRLYWDSAPLSYAPPRNGLLVGPPPTEREATYVTALYDGQIRYVDDQLRRFFDGLGSRWIEEPLIVFTSDHGEVLHEHAHDFNHVYFHGRYPYYQSLRVPFIVHWPSRLEPGLRAAAVDLTGISATLADLVLGGGFDAQVPPFTEVICEDAPRDRAVFGFSPRLYPEEKEKMIPGWEFRRDESWSVLRWPWHLIHHPHRGDLLYDVEADPLEVRDLSATYPERTTALREEVVRHFRSLPRAERKETGPIDERLREQLRSLGYVN